MEIPKKYRGPLRYIKEDCFDFDVFFQTYIEDFLQKNVPSERFCRLEVWGEGWEGPSSWCIPKTTKNELDRIIMWLHEIEVEKIYEVTITTY